MNRCSSLAILLNDKLSGNGAGIPILAGSLWNIIVAVYEIIKSKLVVYLYGKARVRLQRSFLFIFKSGLVYGFWW